MTCKHVFIACGQKIKIPCFDCKYWFESSKKNVIWQKRNEMYSTNFTRWICSAKHYCNGENHKVLKTTWARWWFRQNIDIDWFKFEWFRGVTEKWPLANFSAAFHYLHSSISMNIFSMKFVCRFQWFPGDRTQSKPIINIKQKWKSLTQTGSTSTNVPKLCSIKRKQENWKIVSWCHCV